MISPHKNTDSDVKVSLSPESGSLFHFYHSKLAKMGENADNHQAFNIGASSSSTDIEDQTVGRQRTNYNPRRQRNYHVGREQKPKRNWTQNANANYIYPFGAQRRDKFPSLEMTDHLLAEKEAEKHCSKVFHLKDSSNPTHVWKLPTSERLYTHQAWKVNELVQMKSDLNSVKAQLDCYDIESWHKHTHNCNPAHRISYSVRCSAKPELLTQAFLKFYEILHAFNVVPEEDLLPDMKFKSLHLCEAPGAFIVALNHFLALHRPHVKWDWLGNTLNPYFEGTPSSECIADDRFILFTLDHWFFGKDETGNLMSGDYLEELLMEVGNRKVNLVTADGSIDCQRNPAEQEAMTHALHFSEVYAALCTLKPGGSFVLKKFTFFEAESVSLMFLICCCFDEVLVHKPITSKLGNSEVYVIGIRFNPPPSLDEYLKTLHKFYGQQSMDMTMFSKEQIPSSFLENIINCCSFFKTHQVDAIKRNIELYKNNSTKMDEYCNLLKLLVLNKFTENNVCQPIDGCRRIVPHKLEWDKEITPENNTSKWGGQIMKKSKDERMKFLNDNVTILIERYCFKLRGGTTGSFTSSSYPIQVSVLDSVDVKEGKLFHFVYVSRFCHLNLIQIYVHYCMESITEDELDKMKSSSHHSHESDVCNNDSYKKYVERKKEKTLATIKKIHPEAIIFDDGQYPAPHSCHNAFDELMNLLKEGALKEGMSVAILNCSLLTRLQVGLLNLVGALFEKVTFYEPIHIVEGLPFIVFEHFTSKERSDRLVADLGSKGWPSKNPGGTTIINQVLPLQILIQSVLHPAVGRYNALNCLSNIEALRESHV